MFLTIVALSILYVVLEGVVYAKKAYKYSIWILVVNLISILGFGGLLYVKYLKTSLISWPPVCYIMYYIYPLILSLMVVTVFIVVQKRQRMKRYR